jgi:hypothetical protein
VFVVKAMKRILPALLFLVCLRETLCAQEKAPSLLVHAAQCLVKKSFFPRSRAATLSLGYFLDEKSYPGEKVLYLVDFTAYHRSDGLVFTIVLTSQGDRQIFNIQNNGSFRLSKDEFDGIRFVDPPLGGTWTQQHIAAAIQQIERQSRFTVPVSELSAVALLVDCESYTDR